MKVGPQALKYVAGAAFGFFLGFLGTQEGLSLVGYRDIAGVETYCYGQTGPEAVAGRVYPRELCEKLLSESGRKAWDAADRYVTPPMQPWQQIAFASHIYNFGEGAFARSTMLRKFNAGDVIGACNELPRWNKARVRGELRPVRGLIIRREKERLLCMGYAFDSFYGPNHRPLMSR